MLSKIIFHSGFGVYADFSPDTQLGSLLNVLSVVPSLVTTASATLLIIVKITLVTRQSHRQHYYARIIEILIQSAGILSIVLLGSAIFNLLDFLHPFNLSTTSGKLCWQLENLFICLQSTVEVSNPRCSNCDPLF